MIAVVNATPLIALALLEGLDLLRELFGQVVVPPLVYHEVAVQGRGRPGADALAAADWILVRAPSSSPAIEPLLLGLDAGELQVLLLARELAADWVLLDERLGRRVARAMGLPVKGTIGVLLAAVHAGLMDRDTCWADAQRLTSLGIRVHPTVLSWLADQLDRFEE